MALVLARGLEQIAAEPLHWSGLTQGVIDTLDVLHDTVQQACEDAHAHPDTALVKALRSLRAQLVLSREQADGWQVLDALAEPLAALSTPVLADRKSTRLNSSH